MSDNKLKIGQRIESERVAQGLSKTDIWKGIASSGMYTQWLSGSEPKGRTLVQIAQRLKVNEKWLATGLGQKYKQNDSALDSDPEQNLKKIRSIHGEVPKISWVKAGELCDVVDFLEPGDAVDWLICPVKHGARTFALQVDGPSMDTGDAEGYPDGYDIFVDPDIEPKNGDDVVVRTPSGKATFKRLQITNEGNLLIALNPDWPNRIIPVPEGTIICGVVIYSGRPRRT